MFVSGIASGLDTEQLIQQLMAIERRPLVAMQERKNVLQQQRDAWRDINSRLNNLRDRLSDLSRASLYDRRTATSSAGDVATVSATNAAVEGRYTVIVHELAQAHRVHSDQHESATDALGLSGVSTLAIGGEEAEITIVDTDSLADIAAKINEADVDVSARVIDGYLVIEGGRTGADNVLVFEGDVWEELGVLADGGAIKAENVIQKAGDAEFEVDGLTINRASNTVSDLFEGVTIQLRGEGQSVIEVKRDSDTVIAHVRRFVEQYNSVMSFIGEKSGEKAVLQGDSLLIRIQSQLRLETTAAVAADSTGINQLASVGVTVDRNGVMSLDEARLREALTEHPDDVRRLFAATNDSDGFNGVAARLEARFQGWLETGSGLLAERQKMFGDRMRAIDDNMERFERRLEMRESNLMRQFLALEKVLAGFQTQAMWLDGQIQQLNAMTAAQHQRRR